MAKTKSKWTTTNKPSKMRTSSVNTSGSKQNNPSTTSSGKWKEYVALATVPLVLVLGNSMLVPILPDMERELHISNFQASLVITLFSLAAAIVIPFAGFLSDRFSRKAIMLPCLAIYGIAGIGAGIAAVMHSYGFLIAARALQGIGAAGTAPIAMALVGDMYKGGTESEALGLIEASNGAGKVISPILGSLLALMAWYAPLFAFPLFCAAAFAAMLFMIKEPPNDNEPLSAKQYITDLVKIFREKGVWLLSAFVSGSLGLFILFGVLFRLSDLLEKAPYNIDGVAKGGRPGHSTSRPCCDRLNNWEEDQDQRRSHAQAYDYRLRHHECVPYCGCLSAYQYLCSDRICLAQQHWDRSSSPLP